MGEGQRMRYRTWIAALLGVCLGVFAAQEQGGLETEAGAVSAKIKEGAVMLELKSYAYVLQAEKLAPTRAAAVRTLAESDRDVIVIDAQFWPGAAQELIREDIAEIRRGRAARRVLAYFSIGEAEEYRDYWREEWKDSPPGFLLAENPDWPGNYKVKYWDTSWQGIIFAKLQEILDLGFDGVLLDIVDGFEYFEHTSDGIVDNLVNPDTGNTYRLDMVAFVREIAARARRTRPDFAVVPQNGAQLLSFPEYAATISALALEDLFTVDDSLQPPEHYKYVMSYLPPLLARGGRVMLTEYAQEPELQEHARNMAAKFSLILLLTERELCIIGKQ